MRLQLLAVGRIKSGPDRALFDRYRDRVRASGRQLGFRDFDTVELTEARSETAEQRKAQEATALLERAKLGPDDRLIALDEHGDQATSAGFSKMLATARDDGLARLVFAIGGPDGHGAAVLDAAQRRLSLSQMTLAHGLARIVLAEQIYRAMTLLSGHPYHRS